MLADFFLRAQPSERLRIDFKYGLHPVLHPDVRMLLLQEGRSGKAVKARVCRKVDGLDTHLFEQALAIRRQFLADPAYAPRRDTTRLPQS